MLLGKIECIHGDLFEFLFQCSGQENLFGRNTESFQQKISCRFSGRQVRKDYGYKIRCEKCFIIGI